MERLRDRLALVAEGDREEQGRAAQRLIASLDDSVRMMLLDVLAAAAAEITRELAPGSVELRLREGEPEFVVSTPSEARAPEAGDGAADETTAASESSTGEGPVARINLRLPEQLKARVERAAEHEGLSINAWLVRAVGAVVERGRSGAAAAEPDKGRGVQRFTGWGR
ncbi:MAG TPA: toxin-antitoxin system HicB family antitoxin [Solirubrobacteraceae bacterium]|nr:toxin-antitoxin system HicB family antitoxin [Solirubrobacteraceae bacterium]